MKNSIKRTTVVLILFLSALICTTLLLNSCGDGSDKLTYSLTKDGKGYIVTGCETKNSSKITIPAEYEGLPVIEIGEGAFKQMKNLASVTFPDNIAKIGHSAFAGCSSLKEITLPKGLKEIDGYAFQSCMKLTKVTVSDSLEILRSNAFINCLELCEFNIPSSLHTMGMNVFDGTKITGETVDGVSYYDNWVLSAKQTPSAVSLRDGTVGICTQAFKDNSVLEKIYFGEDLLYIGDAAFDGCTNLSDYRIESFIERIETNAFDNCTSLKSFTFPASLKYVGRTPFSENGSEPISCLFDGTVERWLEISEDAKAVAQSSTSFVNGIGYTVECENGKYTEYAKLEKSN